MKLYSYDLDSGKPVFFASKLFASENARVLSRQVDHVVEVKEHDLTEQKRSFMIEAAANRSFEVSKRLCAFRKGKRVKGWGEE